jgi:ABC-type nitrate/sulfonate/bicarbonate transport system ATPase subunit
MEFEFKETLLYIDGVSVAYDGVVVVKDISLIEKNVVRPNIESTSQVIALIGRSGRGKSSILKALTGLIEPHSGKILIKDFKNKEQDAAKVVSEGDIGFVDQKYTLFRHKTIYQTLKFALRKTDLTAEEKKAKIDSYLDQWGLTEFKDKYPNELSGGQRQRTAIIEQLFCSDKFIILDEPFSGLDIGNIQEVKKSFELLNSSSEFNTVIFTTHDIDLAVELAQSIYVIGYPTINGEKQSYGTIVAKYDLRDSGHAWREYCDDHRELCKEIIHKMMMS